jgi:hypothetical protein
VYSDLHSSITRAQWIFDAKKCGCKFNFLESRESKGASENDQQWLERCASEQIDEKEFFDEYFSELGRRGTLLTQEEFNGLYRHFKSKAREGVHRGVLGLSFSGTKLPQELKDDADKEEIIRMFQEFNEKAKRIVVGGDINSHGVPNKYSIVIQQATAFDINTFAVNQLARKLVLPHAPAMLTEGETREDLVHYHRTIGTDALYLGGRAFNFLSQGWGLVTENLVRINQLSTFVPPSVFSRAPKHQNVGTLFSEGVTNIWPNVSSRALVVSNHSHYSNHSVYQPSVTPSDLFVCFVKIGMVGILAVLCLRRCKKPKPKQSVEDYLLSIGAKVRK